MESSITPSKMMPTLFCSNMGEIRYPSIKENILSVAYISYLDYEFLFSSIFMLPILIVKEYRLSLSPPPPPKLYNRAYL